MQGLISATNIAMSLVAKSIAEPIPQNIDDCIFGFRFIVEFSGKDDNITLITAEVLDSDWELLPEVSIQFALQVEQEIEANRKLWYNL